MSTSIGMFPRSGHVLGQPIVTEYGFFDHFIAGSGAEDGNKFSSSADKGEWLCTIGGTSPTIVVSDAEEGGVVTIYPGTQAADDAQLQLNGETFIINTETETWFECKFKVPDADDHQWFVGLAATDTTVITAVNDSIGFRNLIGTTADIYTIVEDDTTETLTDTAVDLSNDTFVTVQFHIYRRDFVEFAVLDNIGAVKYASGRVTTNIPDNNAALTLTMAVRSTTASANSGLASLEVDYIGCWGRKVNSSS